MWKKRLLCLVLVVFTGMLSACQKKETFPTQSSSSQASEQADNSGTQNLFENAIVDSSMDVDYDDGSYDPASEEGADEDVEELTDDFYGSVGMTPAPTMQSEYAGATPVLIDPIDKPTPTPLPTLIFSYETYEAAALHLTFEAPAGWIVNNSESDAYTLTNPDPSMDYAASLTIRAVPVNRNYSKSDLTKEIKGMLDTLRSSGFSTFNPSNTASRTFLGSDGIYANYTAVLSENQVDVAGRIIVSCVNKTLYILHVSYPRGYTETYVDGVFSRFRKTVKLTDQ